MTENLYRIAVPNKGALSEAAIELLSEAGYGVRRRGRELVLRDADNGCEFFFLRPRDIAVYVADGAVDAGITGYDLLLDSRVTADVHLQLGFGRSRFRFAAPRGQMSEVSDLAGKRVATSFDHLVDDYLRTQNIDAHIVHLEGAVESAISLGVADAIADVVETGSTLRAAGLEVFGPTMLESEAVLITHTGAGTAPALATLTRRIQGVQVAREYVLVDYNIPAASLDQAVALTPGIESPTVTHLHDPSWLAVRAMIKRREINQIMDQLHDLGGRGVLVTQIMACRL